MSCVEIISKFGELCIIAVLCKGVVEQPNEHPCQISIKWTTACHRAEKYYTR